jgi:hypothetical protein
MVPSPIKATFAPNSLALIAAENPADPAPMTTRSGFLGAAFELAQQS